ncbi:MAG: peptide-methionine (S)-S-oxide reductase [Flavobacteriaceae bacterium]
MKTERIGFGGSCHWCTEAVFQSLIGVKSVDQGWISALEEKDYSEAVIVHYNTSSIPLEVLIDIHLRTHNSTSNHSMRSRYRSAIYTFSQRQKVEANNILEKLQAEFKEPLITEALSFKEFRTSDTAFQNYYRQNPNRPFCKSYIDPKLKLIIERFSSYMRT